MDRTTGLLVVGGSALAVGGLILWATRGGSGAGSGSCPAGQIPIQLMAQGPGSITAGGIDSTRTAITICPHLGDAVQYTALADPGHSFLRFEGPGGITTSQNPFAVPAQVAGFVRAVFA